MKIILFGASGMLGQGVLRECLLDPEVTRVASVTRRSSGQQAAKLHEYVMPDLFDLSSIEPELCDYDGCLFCLGASRAHLSESEYRRINHDLPLAVARALLRQSPGLVFEYVSGAGTDSSERGRVMWARVKGGTENALLALPFKAAYMLRPGLIQPLHGIVSRTPLYRVLYGVMGPFFPVLKALAPKALLTTEELGRAMISIVKEGAPKTILEATDLNGLLLQKSAK